jgi:Cu/Ag efflux protein CusF
MDPVDILHPSTSFRTTAKEQVMKRGFLAAMLGMLALTGLVLAQEKPREGTIKKVDADKGIISITVAGKDMDFKVTDDSRLKDAQDKDITDRLKDKRLKEGAPVIFLAQRQDSVRVIRGMKLLAPKKSSPPAGGDIRQGKIKKLDLEKRVLTITVDGGDRDFALTDSTQVLDASGKTLEERLQGFKVGAAIFFKAVTMDGKSTLVGLKLAGRDRPPGSQPGKRIVADTSKLKPLTEMGSELYQGQQGGLYPDGKNERPTAHETAGRRLAKEVQPLNADGKPSTEGKIVLLSVGMSNTSQISTGFEQALKAAREGVNPKLIFVNGAQGGMTAAAIDSLESDRGKRYWSVVDKRLADAGLSRKQVQVAWIKQADAGPSEGFPAYARKLQKELGNIVRLLHERFPNLKLVYLSSRTYGGYATTRLNPEPYAFESGFSVKWLIEDQLKGVADLNYDAKKGAVKAPWLSWGPYLWTNGSMKRGDGFSYAQGDFGPDGTHHAATGVRKTGEQLLKFFQSDSTTMPWFLRAESKE